MPRPAATLPALLALAAAHAGAAVGAASDDAGVVRLAVPAATAPAADAGADADAVVIRAQNRAGRGRTTARPASRVASSRVAPQARPAAVPSAPRSQVRPVSGVYGAPAQSYGEGGPVSGGPIHGGSVHGLHDGPHGGYADCPHCYGHCPADGCPVCLGVPGLPILPARGLFGHLHDLHGHLHQEFHRGGTFVPQHRHEYSYHEPEGLLYPPGADPRTPGKMGPMPVVQYPYYTTKGPDDFFHDRDGEF